MRQVSWIPMMALAGALTAVAAVGATAAAPAAAAVAPAVVLVNQPASSVCVSKTFTVGVWYQQFSGGSRAYRVAVYSPRGRRIFYRHGRASSANWKFWKIRTRLTGKYHTVYSGHWRSPVRWNKYRVTTRAHRC